MAGWIPPAIGYIVILGAAGVTAKLALRTISWQQLVLWVPIAYIIFSAIFVIFKGTTFPMGVGGAWAAATAFAASSALILFFYALTKGPASQVDAGDFGVSGRDRDRLRALPRARRSRSIRGVGTALVVVGVVLLAR